MKESADYFRHKHTSQAFIPMGKRQPTAAEEDKPVQDGACMVVVAINGKDDRPDPKTLRAFFMTSAQGVTYDAGMWRKCLFVIPKCQLTLLNRSWTMDP